jgi:hypothetical protein
MKNKLKKVLVSIEKRGKEFFVSYFNQCQDDYTFVIFGIIEFVTLLTGWLMKVSRLDYLYIHIPAMICLCISLLVFAVRTSKGFSKAKKKIVEWNTKG